MSTPASLHRQMFDTIQARDLDALRGLYHPDYVYTGGDGVELRGADAGCAVAETHTTAFPDLRFEVRHQWTVGEHVSILELTGHGTQDGPLEEIPPTGRSMQIIACNVIEVVDGLIHREREYWDGVSLLKQLGVME